MGNYRAPRSHQQTFEYRFQVTWGQLSFAARADFSAFALELGPPGYGDLAPKHCALNRVDGISWISFAAGRYWDPTVV